MLIFNIVGLVVPFSTSKYWFSIFFLLPLKQMVTITKCVVLEACLVECELPSENISRLDGPLGLYACPTTIISVLQFNITLHTDFTPFFILQIFQLGVDAQNTRWHFWIQKTKFSFVHGESFPLHMHPQISYSSLIKSLYSFCTDNICCSSNNMNGIDFIMNNLEIHMIYCTCTDIS